MAIKIAGTGSYVPERILTNFDLEKMVETNDEWIRTRTGIQERHLAAPDEATSDMAYKAACRAMEMAGISAADLDAIVIATITPDHIFPNTASLLQNRLGAPNAMCFDLSAACSGLLYSLEVAHALMTTRKKYKHVLVIGAEKLSCITDWQDRNTCVLFGDGAGAVILENDGSDGCNTLLAADLHADGNYTGVLNMPAGGSRNPATAETVEKRMHFIHMEGKETFKLAVNGMVSASKTVLAEAGVEASQVRLVVPHQANQRIIDAVAQRLDVEPEVVFSNIKSYGNTSAASIGICLDEIVRNKKIDRGDYLLLTAFGGGLTWGALLFRF
ncbi:MAG: ketoacyl-ACP synthase III [Lentisphaeria bacterium]|jgi:3-oxoacyl-[acyl-carrier-protein] synthase-3|nr:ketoacyl-ACP synthase III [Lentisphaeria bacterium]MBQ8754357.1 ketoacyl-ACP synthase III [Lentisphaeria bacterium]